MKNLLAGLDIGGTKCAVVLGEEDHQQNIEVIAREEFPTLASPEETIERMGKILSELLKNYRHANLQSIGISCGGPLDSEKGLIMSPPNLPHWDHIDIVTPYQEQF